MPGKHRSYRLSPLAESDLEDIWLYTAQNWSFDQADKYLSDIAAACAGIAAGTRTGRGVDVREGYLKLPVGSHFIFYRDPDSSIVVVRVLHQRMDVQRHL
ncbi:MAG TPA: type II toxin-antitoxin system RelE/ParE family toxin [Mesorhizobium sp.]|jgi:toxin ParE1/3/4